MFKRKSKEEDPAVLQKDLFISYKKCFGTLDGKKVLYDLMNAGHVLNTHKGDPFTEGKRSLVLDILHKLHIKEEQLNEMLKGEDDL